MKTTKVYHAPGYPIDPAKEQKRAFENLSDYQCVMIPKKPFTLESQMVEFTFGSMKEAEAFLSARAKALERYYREKCK